MKKNIFLVVLGLMLSACTISEKEKTVVSVLEDTTETDFIAIPNATNIIHQLGIAQDLWKSAMFRYGSINSLIHNSRDMISIPKENALLGNEFERKRLVNDFNKNIKRLLDQPKDSSIYLNSSIWLPIVAELKELQQLKKSKIQLYVFSDLRENNIDWFSTYKPSDVRLLENNMKAVVELFLERAKEITPCKNIEVVIVYQPRNMKEDQLFSRLRKLYEQLFMQLEISIKFKASV